MDSSSEIEIKSKQSPEPTGCLVKTMIAFLILLLFGNLFVLTFALAGTENDGIERHFQIWFFIFLGMEIASGFCLYMACRPSIQNPGAFTAGSILFIIAMTSISFVMFLYSLILYVPPV